MNDCLVTKFYYFTTSEKYRMVFHFIMMESTFSAALSFQDVAKVIKSFCIFFFLDTDCQNEECGLSTSAAYARVFTVLSSKGQEKY